LNSLKRQVEELTAELSSVNEQLRGEISRREQFEETLEGRLRFERLLAEISARFVNLPADQIDGEIEDAQHRICELLDLDRSSLFQVPEGEPGTLLLTHMHQPPGGPPIPERLNAGDLFPWAAQKILGGEILAISKVTHLPPEAARDRENLRLYGTRSVLIVPLAVGGGPVFGLLTFAVMREERDWPQPVVTGFKLIAQVFANALARKRIELALRESRERLSVATDSADAGIWVLDCRTQVFWASEKARAIFGYSADQVISRESFKATVYRDDRQLVQGSIERARQAGEPVNVEYRIKFDDSHTRWIASRGRPHFASSGEVDRIMGLSIDITERKLAEQALEERLRYETLLAEISSRFVNVPAAEVDREIEDAQRRICESLDLDVLAVWQLSNEVPVVLTATHYFSLQEGPQPTGLLKEEDFPWFVKQLQVGRTVVVSSLEDMPAEAAHDREVCRQLGVKSNLSIPLSVGGGPLLGVLGLNTTRTERKWPDMLVKQLQLIGQIFTNALARKRADEQIKKHLEEVEELKQRLERENIYLREEVRLLVEHTNIVAQSLAMKKVLRQAEQVAETDSTVLLLGETGTGKELLARAIHSMSMRKNRPLVTVNCAALPPTLIESELFGREKGAYTGALTRMVGRFEIADGSTLFLDEIGELPHDLQGKLLRVLEEGKFERLGSTNSLQVNVRIMAATNRDIAREVKNGQFRPDLFYRLNVFPIVLPPLREHPEDIPILVRAVVKEFSKKMGKEIESIPKRTMQTLQAYSWPGNVRELRNVIEHAMILSRSKILDIQMPQRDSAGMDASGSLEELERGHIVAVLEKTGWRIAGQGGAAELLGLKRTTLQAKMKKLGIKRSNRSVPK
jgi:formate hydrogenlyase transcriptional activator